jgi:hypothetical protein
VISDSFHPHISLLFFLMSDGFRNSYGTWGVWLRKVKLRICLSFDGTLDPMYA